MRRRNIQVVADFVQNVDRSFQHALENRSAAFEILTFLKIKRSGSRGPENAHFKLFLFVECIVDGVLVRIQNRSEQIRQYCTGTYRLFSFAADPTYFDL